VHVRGRVALNRFSSDLEDSHVIPGLIHKCFLAKSKRESIISLLSSVD
jgi:hypothetical protein